MAIKENLLSVISSIQSGDFLRVVTSDGASRKASLSNVGKWLVENYEGSTVAGSAQSLQSAMSELVAIEGKQASMFTGDVNTLTAVGCYQIGNTASVTNLPRGVGYGILLVDKARGYIVQTYIDLNANNKFIRWSTNTGTSWTDWRSDGSITSMGLPLTSGTDLNTILTHGIYYYHNPASDLVNAPSDAGNYVTLYVVPRANAGRCDQIMLTTNGAFYRAQRDATSFYAWVSLGRVPTQESYTPTISSSTGDQNFATDSAAFLCTKNGQMVLIAGRFRITNAGTTSGSIRISLPEGIDAFDSGVGGCGNVVVDNNSGQFSPRCMSNTLVISKGGDGNYSLPSIGTGYVAVFAVLIPR